MSGISHQQAIQLIHRRLDGLLNQTQLSSLDEHLRSCYECSAYASEMDLLPLHLRHEFHTRWDKKPGPSQNVVEHVTTKARNIPAPNRFSSGTKLFAGAMALILLGVAINFVISQLQRISPITTVTDEPVDSSPLAENRLLAFTSDQNGNFDIYTMHADGADLTNLTNNPARDTYPLWSPDGKHIAFESDRDGFTQIYLMDADGSNLIQLTKDEVDHSLPLKYDGKYNPWSPDGSKLIFVQEEPGGETGTLYSIDINGENKITLAHGKNLFSNISWSPDGDYIAYVLNDSPTPHEFVPDMYVLDSDGSNLRELKKHLPEGEYLAFSPYYWSTNGQSIVFTAFTNDPLRQTMYEFDLETNTFLNKTETKPIVEDWKGDISLIVDVNQEGAPLVWERSDGTRNTFEASKAWGELCSLDFTRSFSSNFAIGVYCPYNKFNLYWANLDGSTIKQLLALPVDVVTGGVGDIAWSPDDQYIAFNITSPDKTDMYVLKVEEALANPSIQPLQIPVGNGIPSWQPATDENITKEIPTPQPTSTFSPKGLIAFASDQNGNLDIYTVRSDGSELANLTNNSAKDYSPAWSPDGTRLAFVSDRDGNENIYEMNADGSNLTRLTDDPGSDTVPLWSPDGTQIAYASRDADGKIADIYVMDSNGQNHRRLTDNAPDPDAVWPEAWSPDGEHIFFYMNQQIVKINLSNGDVTPVTPQKDIPYQFALSKDGSKILYLAGCGQNSAEFCNRARTIQADGANEETNETVKLQQVCVSKETPPTKIISHYYMVKWSPDRSKILFAFYCEENGGLFYIANADGSDFKPLTNYPILFKDAAFDWSPDSQAIVFSSALEDSQSESLYLLNVNDALQNPELRPTQLNTSASQISSLAWQPQP